MGKVGLSAHHRERPVQIVPRVLDLPRHHRGGGRESRGSVGGRAGRWPRRVHTRRSSVCRPKRGCRRQRPAFRPPAKKESATARGSPPSSTPSPGSRPPARARRASRPAPPGTPLPLPAFSGSDWDAAPAALRLSFSQRHTLRQGRSTWCSCFSQRRACSAVVNSRASSCARRAAITFGLIPRHTRSAVGRSPPLARADRAPATPRALAHARSSATQKQDRARCHTDRPPAPR